MADTEITEPTVVDALVLVDGGAQHMRLNGGQLRGVACVYCDGRHRPMHPVGRLASGGPVMGCAPSCNIYHAQPESLRDFDPVPDGFIRHVQRMWDSVEHRSPVRPEHPTMVEVAEAVDHIAGCARCTTIVRDIEAHAALVDRLANARTLHDALDAARALEAHDQQAHQRVQAATS